MEPSALGGGLGQSTGGDAHTPADRLVGLRIGIFRHGTVVGIVGSCTWRRLEVVVGGTQTVNLAALGVRSGLRRCLPLVLGLLLPGGPVLLVIVVVQYNLVVEVGLNGWMDGWMEWDMCCC